MVHSDALSEPHLHVKVGHGLLSPWHIDVTTTFWNFPEEPETFIPKGPKDPNMVYVGFLYWES